MFNLLGILFSVLAVWSAMDCEFAAAGGFLMAAASMCLSDQIEGAL